MNVIVANEARELLTDLNIEVIKSVEGEYSVEEFIDIFKNMFFARMILDVTAIKDYKNIENIQKVFTHLPADKIILFLPTIKETTSSVYLSQLISMGAYNFTTNLDGVKYLLKNPNNYKDVAHFQQLSDLSSNVSRNVEVGTKVFGIRNLTNHAGATTLIYMLKQELESSFGMVVYALEIGRHDFGVFNDERMLSIDQSEISNTIGRFQDADVILIDMNDTTDDDLCGNVLYLLEPSIIMLNKLVRRNKNIFSSLKGARIVLNKSFLSNKDISELEFETKSKFFYNIPCLDDRKKHDVLCSFLSKLGFNNYKDNSKPSNNKIVGMFKK